MLNFAQYLLGRKLLVVEHKHGGTRKPLSVKLAPYGLAPSRVGHGKVYAVFAQVVPEGTCYQVAQGIQKVVSTLATGLNNTGFISWFGKLLAGSLSGYSPTMVMVALIVVFYLLRYFFASATAYTSALAPMMIAAALAMPEIPLPVFCLMVGAAIGLGSILTPYATGPSPIYYGSGYLPTADYWRLGAIFGLIFLVLLVITGLLWMPVVLL